MVPHARRPDLDSCEHSPLTPYGIGGVVRDAVGSERVSLKVH